MNDSEVKVTKLLEFLKEFSSVGQKTKININDEQWVKFLSDIPQYKDYVRINLNKQNRDADEPDNDSDADVLVEVTRPEPFVCKDWPDQSIVPWIKYDWQHRYKAETTHENELEIETSDGVKKVLFEDNEDRVRTFERWKDKRDKWREEQINIHKVDDFFDDLYRLYSDLNVDSETKEFVCANGFISSPEIKRLNYPILSKRVRITFDATKNSISIRDTESPSRINSMLLNTITTGPRGSSIFSNSGIKKISEENEKNDYHPFDPAAVSFFETAVKELNPKSKILQEGEIVTDSELEFSGTEVVLTFKPVFLVRKKMSGVPRAIDSIVANIKKTDYIPETLLDIIGQNSISEEEEVSEPDDIQSLAELGGEDPDILLPLQANREQLEIARRIEKYNAVVVQGPPGTGKTHTIANLLGQFLAEGKSVLVTSDTKKALSVLKDKVPVNLQNLCVSLLDDNHEDMERSINGIMDYQSSHNEFDVRKKVDEWTRRRNSLINELADIRKHIRDIKNSEFNPVTYNGEKYTLSEMGKYVHDNKNLENIIPGEIERNTAFPLSQNELVDLYASNNSISKEDELNANAGLPDPDTLVQPYDFQDNISKARKYLEHAKKLAEQIGFALDYENNAFVLRNQQHKIHLSKTNVENISKLSEKLDGLDHISSWQENIILAGKNGDSYRKPWLDLIKNIVITADASQASYEVLISHEISVNSGNNEELTAAVKEVKDVYDQKSRIGTLDRLRHKKAIAVIEEAIKIDGHVISSSDDCEAVLKYLDLDSTRKKSSILWDKLISNDSDEPSFYDLSSEPENVAMKYIPDIKRYLNWYQEDFAALSASLTECGINSAEIFDYDRHLPDKDILDIILNDIGSLVLPILEIQNVLLSYRNEVNVYESRKKELLSVSSNSKLLYSLKAAYEAGNPDEYEKWFNEINEVYSKSELISNRNKAIEKLKLVAPQWAAAIQNREGIHGKQTVPDHIQEAWKCKQFDEITEYYDNKSFEKLQAQSIDCSKQYREATEKLCEYSAWEHLLKKIESNKDMQRSLKGWADTVKKIGAGYGKMASYYKKIARQQMAECQNAVPVWIMTTSQVFDNLNPGINKFDVIIVDESSQSNITALSLLYYGKKAVIVGDDKQVSPLNIGYDVEAVTKLNENYLKDTGIPNYHLYTTRTSLYDLAATTFKPLMLHEHFRCVPAIIGFSNMLSYDYKIRPLRDQSSSNLLPPLVAVNAGGHRDNHGKNVIEAKTVIALLKTFLEMPEYQDKTFGVISLLSSGEQVRYLQQKIDIPAPEMEKHKILIGTSAQFQGDERDVIILTMVDSNENGGGPLRELSYGSDDVNRKRYNVAVSRAKDQLWVVHSLDMHDDLKPDDLRRKLLEYVDNPQQYLQNQEASVKSESPFELAVARCLNEHGFKIKQQWQAGAYRIDMVAIDDTTNKKIAIECDGEQYHSGEEKIQQDMERQTILERAGWTFIRIRGSEYFKDPESTMNHVMKTLEEYDVHPYSSYEDARNDTSLEQCVLENLRNNLSEEDDDPDVIADRIKSADEFAADLNNRMAEKKLKDLQEQQRQESAPNGSESDKPNAESESELHTAEENISDKDSEESKQQSPDHSGNSVYALIEALRSVGINCEENNDSIVIAYDHKKASEVKKICEKYGKAAVYASPLKANNKTGNWVIRK